MEVQVVIAYRSGSGNGRDCLGTAQQQPPDEGIEKPEPDSSAIRGKRWQNHRFFHFTMTGIALVFITISVGGLYLTNTTVDFAQIPPRAILLSVLLAGAAFYRWRRLPRAVNLIMMTFWAMMFGILHLIPMFIAARMKVDLCDATLATFDAAMGAEVPGVLKTIQEYPTLNHFLRGCYDTLLFLVTLAIMIPAFAGKMQAAKEYAIGSLVSAMLSLPLFAVFQAVGPWVYYNYIPELNQDDYMRTFFALKSQETYVLDLAYRDGLICFPSFHTILAVLAGVALWSIPYLRWAAAALAALIVVSTVTTGTHYVVDVVAGLGVAFVAFGVAKGYTWLELKVSRPAA